MIISSIRLLYMWIDFMKVDVYVDEYDLEQRLIDIEYKSEEVILENNLTQNKITKIVIHHTGTPYNQNSEKLFNSIQNNHSKRWINWWIDKTWQQMMYHRMIANDWMIYWDKSFDEIGRWTKANNIGVAHIALQGNFNETKPSEIQYEHLSQIIQNLRKRYWPLEVIGHWQLENEATACPWKNFDRDKLREMIWDNKPVVEEIQSPEPVSKIYTKVESKLKSRQVNSLMQYALNTCNSRVKNTDKYSCQNFVLTLNAENTRRNPSVVWKPNSNWTRDHWICQLNDKYHSPFINSDRFRNELNQVDYCLEVREDAIKKKVMPWRAFEYRFERWRDITFS